jgi:hypothetical protein
MVVVNKLTKVAHFIPIKMMHRETNIAKIYMNEIVELHSMPKAIVSDKDPKFTSNFWKGLFKGFETKFQHSISSRVGWADKEDQPNN